MNGRDLTDNMGTAMLVGAATGAISAGVGQATREVSSAMTKTNADTTIGQEVGRNAAIRVGA